MHSLLRHALAAAILTLLADRAFAQTNNTQCFNGTEDMPGPGAGPWAGLSPNATGVYTRPSPFLSDNGTSSGGDWTYNIDVLVDKDNHVGGRVWVQAPKRPNINGTVCMHAWTEIPRNVSVKGQDDTGDCVATLGQDCVDALLQVKPSVIGEVGQPCDAMTTLLSLGRLTACAPFGIGHTSMVSQALDASAAVFDRATCDGPGEIVFQYASSPGYESRSTSDSKDFNKTAYDDDIYQVVPVLNTPIPSGGTANAFESSQLICIRARDIKDGSRVPPSVSAAGARSTALKGVFGLALVSIVMLLG